MCRGCGRGACGRGATPRRRPLGSATSGAKPSTLRMAAAISGARRMVERQCLQVQRWSLRSCYVLLRACGRATCSATLSERQHVCSWFLGCAHSQNSPAPLKAELASVKTLESHKPGNCGAIARHKVAHLWLTAFVAVAVIAADRLPPAQRHRSLRQALTTEVHLDASEASWTSADDCSKHRKERHASENISQQPAAACQQ